MLAERETPQSLAEVIRRLKTAIGPAVAALAGVQPGRLVSLSVPLPEGLMLPDAVPGGDSRWLALNDGLRLHAGGEVVRFDADAAIRFPAECSRWHLLGHDAEPPLAFFTVPPATTPSPPRLWVPRIVVRQGGGAPAVILSAWWNTDPPEAVARTWLREARRMFAGPSTTPPPPCRLLAAESAPDGDEWERRVRQVAQAVTDGRLTKLVLARRLSARLSGPADWAGMTGTLARLNPDSRVFSLPYGPGRVLAASPELLAVKRDRRLVSHAVAGTARRHGDDGTAAAALLASAKERREHAVVVEAIACRLAELCDEMEDLPEPAVMSLRFLQHLWTPIAGRLRPEVGLLDAVARLHPTPAVLGSPPGAAIAWLREIGEKRDGLYTGVAGWIDRDGDGEAAVVLRSAYIEDCTAVLWAGAGIMADSDPQAEWAETEMKLAGMLEVLNAP